MAAKYNSLSTPLSAKEHRKAAIKHISKELRIMADSSCADMSDFLRKNVSSGNILALDLARSFWDVDMWRILTLAIAEKRLDVFRWAISTGKPFQREAEVRIYEAVIVHGFMGALNVLAAHDISPCKKRAVNALACYKELAAPMREWLEGLPEECE